MFKRTRPDEVRIIHPLGFQYYNYVLGRRFDPGAEAEAFQQLFALPIISFRGAARLAGTLDKIQPPQVMVPLAIRTSGIPTIAGQFILQGINVEGESGT